jgi:hypothetical protein
MAKRKAGEVLDVIAEGGKPLDVRDLARELLSAFGGPRSFAYKFHQEYEDKKSTAISRAKMLEAVLRVFGQAAAREQDPAGNLGRASTEDLMAEMVSLLRLHGAQVSIGDNGVSDACEEKPAAGPAA